MQAAPVHSVGAAQRYAEAVACALVASWLSWVMRDQVAGAGVLPLWVMSAFVAWRGGFGPVVVASLLAVLVREAMLFTPMGWTEELTRTEWMLAIVYLGVSALMGRRTDALRRSRAQLIAAADGMIDAMMVYDAGWRLVYYNATGRALVAALGLDPKALRGRVVWDAVPALRGTPFETETRRAREENRVIEYEARYPEANIWLHVRSVPTADGGVTTFAHDVTPTQIAETERHRTDARYHALVEASTMMVWSTDPAGNVIDMPVWRAITGQSLEEVAGSGWSKAIHPDDRMRVEAAFKHAVADERQYEASYRLRHADGSYRWYRARGVPIRENGRIVEWVGVFDDIHDEHLAKERHATLENALAVLGVSLDYEWNLAAVTRLLVPTLADYCSVDLLDSAGVLRRVSSTHADPAKDETLHELWRRFPYGPDDPGAPSVVKTGAALLVPMVDPQATAAYARSPEHARLLTELSARSFLCVPMVTREQTFGALSLVYSDSGRTYSSAELAVAEQIASRAATAIENARLYADAQAANRAKGDFLATMSHELRTPLNAIAGYADLLLMGVRGSITDDQRRDLSRIRQNQQHLLEIITDILNFSRIEAGHTRYDLGAVALGDVLERMEGVIAPLALARQIGYEYVAPSDELAVTADREKLEQVLINLLGNAVKFTPSGGKVSLTTACVGDRVRIQVRDTGVGIHEHQLASIFQPFVQLEPALTRTAEGTGLGLAIARELTRGMGGELSATSVPMQGSIFTVELSIAVSPS